MAGVWVLLAGLGSSVALSEGVLWGLRTRVGALFRSPYYAPLALFLLYPPLVLLSERLADADSRSMFGEGVNQRSTAKTTSGSSLGVPSGAFCPPSSTPSGPML